MIHANDEIEVEGTFVQHWEVPRFVVAGPPLLWGVLPAIAKWAPHFPSDTVFPPLERRGPARYFRVRARGRLGPPGAFGHMGVCSHEFFISRVLSCAETSDPGKTW